MSQFRIDTRGTCLLCLRSNGSPSENYDNLESTTAFKMLLRYLKVDVAKLIRGSFSVQSNGSFVYNDNLQVSLCEDCSSVSIDFLELYQAFEGIRIQLDLCIRQLQEFMEKGGKDSERIREYEAKMNTGNIQDLICGSIAGNLRKELAGKARRKVDCSIPRISVQNSNKAEKHKHEKSDNLSTNEQAIPFEKMQSTFESSGSSVHLQHSPEEPAINEQPQKGSPWKCDYCPQSFFRQINLQTHQYNKHAMPLLSDKGLLPSSISERQLESALGNIMGQMKSSIVTCPYCSKKHAKYHLRAHLLFRHLHEIIEKAKKVSSAPQINRKKTPWKCVPCQMYYSQKHILQRHQISKHTMTTLAKKRVLPSHISEHQLEAALSEMGLLFDGNNCPFCGSRGFGGISLKRIHLLQLHLDYVIENAEKVPVIKEDHLHSPFAVDVVALEDETKRMEQANNLLNCANCDMNFASRRNLEVHQYHKHAMIILKDDIPDHVSEQDIIMATWRIGARMKIISRSRGKPLRECHLCTSRVWGNFKVHLLKSHLDQVIREVEMKGSSASFSSQIEYRAEAQAYPSLI